MNDLINAMVDAFCEDADDDILDAADYAADILMENADILEEIAELYDEGELTEAEFEEELEDQRVTLETQLLALVVMEKAALQKAIDNALNVFRSSVVGF